MQKRIKTYGKHGSRIITVTEDRNTTIPHITATQATRNNHVSASGSNDDEPSYLVVSNRGKSAPVSKGKMDDSRPKTSNNNQPQVGVGRPKPIKPEEIRKQRPLNVDTSQIKQSSNFPSLPQHQARRQASPIVHTSKPGNSTRSKRDKAPHNSSESSIESSDSSDSLPPFRRGARVGGGQRRYIFSEDSESSYSDSNSESEAEELVQSSEADSPLPTSSHRSKRTNRPQTQYRSKHTDKGTVKTSGPGVKSIPTKTASHSPALKLPDSQGMLTA